MLSMVGPVTNGTRSLIVSPNSAMPLYLAGLFVMSRMGDAEVCDDLRPTE
jgi:hypothetical protein